MSVKNDAGRYQKKRYFICVQSSHHVRVEMVLGYAHAQNAHNVQYH